MEKQETNVKYCKCGCVISGNFHVNTNSAYHDKTVKGYSPLSELGNVWVTICELHKCRKPIDSADSKPEVSLQQGRMRRAGAGGPSAAAGGEHQERTGI